MRDLIRILDEEEIFGPTNQTHNGTKALSWGESLSSSINACNCNIIALGEANDYARLFAYRPRIVSGRSIMMSLGPNFSSEPLSIITFKCPDCTSATWGSWRNRPLNHRGTPIKRKRAKALGDL